MLEKEITFDRFIRWIIILAGICIAVWLLNRLKSVLWPFFIAWWLAYMVYPMVHFIQYRLHLRNRVLSITVSMLLILGLITGALALVIPPTLAEFARLYKPVSNFLATTLGDTKPLEQLITYFNQYVDGDTFMGIIQQSSFMQAVQNVLTQAWRLIAGTFNFAIGLLGIFVILLYMFFILFDYERISTGWIRLVPPTQRNLANMVFQDVKQGMNAYFRGQSLIALLVGILFSIGFLIIDFPLAIGLGLFIGVLNLVPYLQLIGFLPTILLALLKASETGQNFWLILLSALIVFAVVQAIQDMYLTPRIMGQVTGLNPAIILLSLSVWGSLLGIIGFVIALPLTTICLSYYKRYILMEESERPKKEDKKRKESQKST